MSGTGLCRASFAVYEQMEGTFSSTSEERGGYRKRFLSQFSNVVKHVNKLEIYLMMWECCFVLEAT